MKIVYIIPMLCIGGAETLVTNYLIELKKRGEDVALLQIYSSDSFLYDQLRNEGIEVYSLYKHLPANRIIRFVYKKLYCNLFFKKKFCNKIKETNPDVIHFHGMVRTLGNLNIPYSRCFYTFHTKVGRTFSSLGKRNKSRCKKSLIEACKKGLTTVALSEEMAKDIKKELGEVKTVIIPNGIDIDKIRSQAVDRKNFCEEIGVPQDAFILGHVGRFHPVKNHEKIIDIFNEVHRRKPNSYLVLVGADYKQRKLIIEERIKKLKLENSVVLLGLREDAKGLIAAFDCFILPSHVEGFPLSFEEAQAHGVRAIATSVVPNELLVNNNAFKLDVKLADSVWADYILGYFEEERGRDIKELDIDCSITKSLKEYGVVVG